MTPTITIILIIIVVVIVAAVVYGLQIGRRKKLQSTFGPEYDRAVADTGNRTEAEKELREREKRHARLELKELSPESQATYAAAWEEVQILFVDNPSDAVNTADDLVTRLVSERGYPTGEYDERLADLSVAHANTLQHYRDAHDISERNRAGSAGTEDLRVALVHYRALFADLLGADPVPTLDSTASSAPSHSTRAGSPADSGPTDPSPADSDPVRADSARPEKRPAPAPRRAADDVAPDTRR